jgi:hypothetical protein
LTAVAGTAVLGVQFAILTPFMTVAASLWVFAVLLWIILIHTVFAAVTVAEPKPSLEVAINRFSLLVSWEVLYDFQPFIGGYTVFLGDRNGGRRIGENIRKGLPLAKPTPPTTRSIPQLQHHSLTDWGMSCARRYERLPPI